MTEANGTDIRHDGFEPPNTPVEVRCLHCDTTYMSDLMKFECRNGSTRPLWWCSNRACDGAGFGFDIFPITDPI